VEFTLNWLGGFEVNEKDKAITELTREQANRAKLQYMTVNEVRGEKGLDAVEEGDVIPGIEAIEAKNNQFRG
jgi:hypothetical protein